MVYDLVIIGSGVAGFSAGIYAGRYRMKTLIIGEEFGGESARAGVIWNYPGARAVDGYDLVSTMKKQAKESGAEITEKKVSSISVWDGHYEVSADSEKIGAKSILFAQGAKRRRLELPREEYFINRGVHYCATCDGPLYVGKTVAVVGGGNAAAKTAELLSEYAKKVFIIVRKDSMRADPFIVDDLKKIGNKIEISFGTEIIELYGDKKIEKVTLTKEFLGSRELSLDGLFVEIGATPNTALPKNLGVELDNDGYIKVDKMMRTNVPGVFAAGDTADIFGDFKQCITAAATGAVAATSAYRHAREISAKD